MLAAARHDGCRVRLSPEQRPADLAAAYAIQHATAQALALQRAGKSARRLQSPCRLQHRSLTFHQAGALATAHLDMIGVEAAIARKERSKFREIGPG
jgi:hypothetical protein